MTRVRELLDKRIAGERFSAAEGLFLYENANLAELGAAANQIKELLHPGPYTTFVIGRNINYSNVCDTGCKFCAFHKKPGEKGGYVLKTEEILAKIEELVGVGGTEILMQGGTHPGLPLSYYLKLLRTIKEHYPQIHIHSFSTSEILKMVEKSGETLESVIMQLKSAGLDSLPGAGAEILDDRIRLAISANKGSWQEWMHVMKTANRLGLSSTGTMVIGFGETLAERIAHLVRLRDAQDETGGFTAFIPWTFQPDNTELAAEQAANDDQPERVSPDEYLKIVAISRLMLDNISNIQASWVTMGGEVGIRSLSFGCNDFGSTMMEENVVAAAGTTFTVNTNQVLDLIREAGFIPAQRNTKYEILRVFAKGERVIEDFTM